MKPVNQCRSNVKPKKLRLYCRVRVFAGSLQLSGSCEENIKRSHAERNHKAFSLFESSCCSKLKAIVLTNNGNSAIIYWPSCCSKPVWHILSYVKLNICLSIHCTPLTNYWENYLFQPMASMNSSFTHIIISPCHGLWASYGYLPKQ